VTLAGLAARRLEEMVSLMHRVCAISAAVACQAIDQRRAALGPTLGTAHAAVRRVIRGMSTPGDFPPTTADMQRLVSVLSSEEGLGFQVSTTTTTTTSNNLALSSKKKAKRGSPALSSDLDDGGGDGGSDDGGDSSSPPRRQRSQRLSVPAPQPGTNRCALCPLPAAGGLDTGRGSGEKKTVLCSRHLSFLSFMHPPVHVNE